MLKCGVIELLQNIHRERPVSELFLIYWTNLLDFRSSLVKKQLLFLYSTSTDQ